MGAPDDPSTELLPQVADPMAAPAEAPLTSLIGRTFGRFVIVERLGKGGSGEVFRAQQVQLGRSAVIKVLRREVAGVPNRVERFLREAKLASRLDHPYAAHVYGFGAEPDGVLWIAMEHVRGMTLDELVARRGPMPAHVFAPLFSRLCEVVHSAHELGIVHRDIKGANVMVIERAGQLLPKLLDFGIAKLDVDTVADDDAAPEGELTGHGVTLGSPHYMSPEQWERPHEVDARADIYALGVLAYRCLAGQLPYQGRDRTQLAHAHTKEPVPPLPDFVPAQLAKIVMRALAKQPGDRFASAIELSQGIASVSGARVVAEPVPIFDPGTRDAWLGAGPQPIADALAQLTSATTTVEMDAALRELVAITCRWLAVLALAGLPETNDPKVREQARAVVGRDDGGPWLELARAAVLASLTPLPGLAAALAAVDPLVALADRLDDRDRHRTAAALAADVDACAEALRALESLLAYQLVVGGAGSVAESWQGPRRRERDKVLVWGAPLADREVALLDANGQVALRLSPFAQVIAPLPAAEPELFLLWRSGRGAARLVAAPWGFERDDDVAGEKLAALSTEESDTAADPADRSPYPGLAAYGVDDADCFVGREREVESLTNRLVRAPLVAVLGPSGVGKSSFIHAGLVPRLGEQHRVLTMRPGRHPMHALATLPQVSGDSEDDAAIAARLRELGDSAQRGLVLVIDQLEELVTLCADETQRRRFAETLAAATDGPGAPVRVVATLRDDFATVIESQAALSGRWDVFVLATPPPEALRRIVIEPARRAGVSIDARVVDDMVAEVAGRPASLPLLSFTAAQLWQTRDRAGRRITHDAYLEIGGVAGALATYADQIYGSLARRDQDTVRDLFARLVAADGTRIPSPRTELEQLAGAPGVLAHLIDARLLVVRDDDGIDAIEIIHECLAERWPRLARWRSEDAADRALLGDVRAAARRWNEAGRRADLLWRGQALAELVRLTTRSTALTELERAFAHDSTRAQQRARRIRRGIVAAIMIVLAGVASVMAYLSVVANESRADAERSATKAAAAAQLAEERLTASLIAQGRRELNDGRAMPALAYFAAAMKRGADTTALRAMVSIAARGWRDTLVTDRRAPYSSMTGSPSGWIAAGDHKGGVRYFSDQGELLAELSPDLGPIAMVSRQADDSLLVAAQRGVIHYGPNREVVRRIATEDAWLARLGPGTDEITTAGEGKLVVWGFDGTLRRSVELDDEQAGLEPVFDPATKHALVVVADDLYVLDLVTMKQKLVARQIWANPVGSRDGNVFAYADRERRVYLIDITGKQLAVIEAADRPDYIVFSAAGDRLGIVRGASLSIYDTKGTRLLELTIQRDQFVYVLGDNDVWVTGAGGVVRRYENGDLVASIPAHATEINHAVLGRDALALLGADATLVFVRARAAQLQRADEVCPRPSYGSNGIATGYLCSGTVKLYLGRQHIADYPGSYVEMSVAYHAPSQRAAVNGNAGVHVFERGALLVKTDKRGATAFEDADHLWLAEPKQGLWRWTLATNTWEQAAPITDAYAIAVVGSTVVVGTQAGELIVLANRREVKRLSVGEQVGDLVLSPDGRWLAVHLATGATSIVDTRSWQIARNLAPADNYGAAPTFDATGDLLMRSSRNALTIWDRATGEELVFGLDLLQDLSNGRFLPDGRIELNRRRPALLDIPRDTRPISQILADIACKVPLEVDASRIEPKTPVCP